MSFDDENIRLPDEVKRETLLYDNNNNYSNIFDKELEEAIYQSIQLYENEMQKNEEFEQKFQDLTAEFSMKKFWNEFVLDITISQREVDFDEGALANSGAELVNKEHSRIWGYSYPL